MIIGLLICAIGILPIVLAISMQNIYRASNLHIPLTLYMVLIAFWQFDVGILHLEDVLSQNTVLILFKIFRAGPTFSIPVVYYIAYSIFQRQTSILRGDNRLSKTGRLFFNNKIFYLLSLWTLFVYIVSWTPWGIKGIKLVKVTPDMSDYFPIYGSLEKLYLYHMAGILLFYILVAFILRQVSDKNTKHFIKSFIIYSLSMYVFGFANFSPKVGEIPSSIGVIIFSTLIMREYIKMLSNDLSTSYYEVMVRQKKLDYTGNLAASLIHEVKNTNQITKGFSNMLMNSKTLSERDKSFLEMIHKASTYFEDLSDNYQDYISLSKMKLKHENIEHIIQQAIELSKGIQEDSNVKIEFINLYTSLKAYVNKTHIEQVFINLIKNSVEATPEYRDPKKITIRTELDADSILIHFIDSGIGIDSNSWESVFEPFSSTKEDGMGLGLPYIKKILMEHLGDIYIVESSPEGTHFIIELPQHGKLMNGENQSVPVT